MHPFVRFTFFCTERYPCPMKVSKHIKQHCTWTHRSSDPWDLHHNFFALVHVDNNFCLALRQSARAACWWHKCQINSSEANHVLDHSLDALSVLHSPIQEAGCEKFNHLFLAFTLAPSSPTEGGECWVTIGCCVYVYRDLRFHVKYDLFLWLSRAARLYLRDRQVSRALPSAGFDGERREL